MQLSNHNIIAANYQQAYGFLLLKNLKTYLSEHIHTTIYNYAQSAVVIREAGWNGQY
jgi:hypothetical protein